MENSMTALQRVIGLMNRNKIHMESINFSPNEGESHASLHTQLSGDETTVKRVLGQLSKSIEVISVEAK